MRVERFTLIFLPIGVCEIDTQKDNGEFGAVTDEGIPIFP